jgi:hypothetical protein
MADTTYVDFQAPAVNAAWLNDVNDNIYTSASPPTGTFRYALGSSSALTDGDAMVKVVQPFTGAVDRTQHQKNAETVSLADFGADLTGATASDTAVNAAIAYLVSVGGGTLDLGVGTILLNGTTNPMAGADSYADGIKLPDTGTDFSTGKGILIRGRGVNTVLKAGSNNMVMVRASRLYSGGSDFRIDANGKTGIIGLGIVPESMTQTTGYRSQSYQEWSSLHIENCDEGVVVQPGPTVLGTDSGCFYITVDNVTTNLCKRGMWFKSDVTGANNRCTRSKFYVKCLRGNTGIQIDGGTELEFRAYLEFHSTGTSPNAVPAAILVNGSNCVNLKFAGYSEIATRGMELNTVAAPYTDITEWEQNTARHSSLAFAKDHRLEALNIPRNTNRAAVLSFGYNGFVDFTADPDQTDSKTLDLRINGTKLWRWDSTRKTTMYGSSGNIEFDPSGANFTFTRNGTTVVENSGAAGSLRLKAKGLEHLSDGHTFYPYAGGTPWMLVLSSGVDHYGQNLRLRTSRTPASAGAAGNQGEICWDSNYIYVCVATNTWKRTAIAAW